MKAIGVLLRYAWRQHRFVLLPMIGGIVLFEFLLTRIAPAPNEVSWMQALLSNISPQLLELIGGDVAFSTKGFLTFGYVHPFVLLLLSAWTVRVSSGSLSGEIGRGTMDLLASRPVRRWQLLAAGSVAMAIGVTLLVGAAWIGSAAGLALRDLGETPRAFAGVAAVLWLLFVAWGAVGFVVSAIRRDSGSAIGWTSGIIAASFVLDYLARMWDPIARLRPLSLFAYYRPQLIGVAGVDRTDVVRLGLVAVIALAVAMLRFERRDL